MARPIYEAYAYRRDLPSIVKKLKEEGFFVVNANTKERNYEASFLPALYPIDYFPLIFGEDPKIECESKEIRRKLAGAIDTGFKVDSFQKEINYAKKTPGPNDPHFVKAHQRCIYVCTRKVSGKRLGDFLRNSGRFLWDVGDKTYYEDILELEERREDLNIRKHTAWDRMVNGGESMFNVGEDLGWDAV
jgi:hypothetical protein